MKKYRYKSKIFFIIISIVLCSLSSIIVFSNRSSGKTEMSNYFENMAKVDMDFKNKRQKGNDQVKYQGNTISIYNIELNQIIERNKVFGVNDPEKAALDFLIERELIFQKALQNYPVPSDQDVLDKIQINREIVEQSENYEDFESYLTIMQMTSDEFWTSDQLFSDTQKFILIEKYQNEFQQAIISHWNFNDGTDPQTIEDTYNTEYHKMLHEAIQQENIVEVK